MDLIKPQDRVTCSSAYSLNTTAFDIDNSPGGSFRKNLNSLVTPDFPKGVLGGMVAVMSGDWEVTNGIGTKVPIGLFNKNSEGSPFSNSPALASGKLGLWMNGGSFLCYLWETNGEASPYTAFDLPTVYAVGNLLYCSAYSLMTAELPSVYAGGGGLDYAVAVVTKVPTTVDQELGIKLII